MLALRRPVAASGPLVGAYSGLPNRTRKIEKPRFGEIFLIFFRFPRDIDHHLGAVISNIQQESGLIAFDREVVMGVTLQV
jgi:hypothetical protein